MLMMRPQRRFIMPRAVARMATKAPRRLASSTASQSSSLRRNRMLSRVRPALLTRMSICPNAFSTACDERGDGRRVADVAGEALGAGPDGGGRLGGLRLVAADDGDAGAGGGERLGDGAPDAARAAGDERDAPGEVDVHAVTRVEERVDVRGGAARDDLERRRDLLRQAREHRARPHLDEQRVGMQRGDVPRLAVQRTGAVSCSHAGGGAQRRAAVTGCGVDVRVRPGSADRRSARGRAPARGPPRRRT